MHCLKTHKWSVDISHFANEQLLCWKFFSLTLHFWGTPCLSSASVPWKQPSKSAQNGAKVSQSGPNQHFKCFRPCWTFLHAFGKVGKKLFSEVEDTLKVIYVIGVFSLWKQLFPKVSKSVWKYSRGVLKWSKPLFKVFLSILDLLQHFWNVLKVFGSWAVTVPGTDHGLKIHLRKILADRPEIFFGDT